MTQSYIKMNKSRAEELLIPLRNDKAKGISLEWKKRLIEALEYVIEHETEPKKKAHNPRDEWYPNMDAE